LGYSPPRRGGECCGINKSREATEEAADGVVSSAKCLGLKGFAEPTTPAAPISERIHFIDGASTPPLRGGEYSAAFLSIANSFTPSMTAGDVAGCCSVGGHRPPLPFFRYQYESVWKAAIDARRHAGALCDLQEFVRPECAQYGPRPIVLHHC